MLIEIDQCMNNRDNFIHVSIIIVICNLYILLYPSDSVQVAMRDDDGSNHEICVIMFLHGHFSAFYFYAEQYKSTIFSPNLKLFGTRIY